MRVLGISDYLRMPACWHRIYMRSVSHRDLAGAIAESRDRRGADA
jgi:hypothetical protein